MSQTPVVIPSAMQNLVMTPPEEYMPALAGLFGGAYERYSSQFRSISLKGFQFVLRDSGNATVYPQQTLPCVILGTAPDLHCVWYRDKFTENAESNEPDAIWWNRQGAPACVPPEALQKDAEGRNQYATCHRIVIAIFQQDPHSGSVYLDLENPYVFDVKAKSLFGTDYTQQFAYTLSGLMRLCKSLRVLPLQFVTQIQFDRTASVPVVRFVPAHQGNQITFLDNNTAMAVYQAAVQPQIADMLKIRVTGSAPSEAPVQASAPISPVQVAPVQPAPVQAPQVAPVQPAPVQAPQAPQVAPVQPAPVQTLQVAPVQPAPVQTPQVSTQNAELMNAANTVAQQAVNMLTNVTPAPAAPAAPEPAAQGMSLQNALSNLLEQAGSYSQKA